MSIAHPPDADVGRILYLALDAGEEVLAAGAGSADAAATMQAVALAAGLREVEVDVNFTSLSITWAVDRDSQPWTRRRMVLQRTLDYTRLIRVHRLLGRLVRGEVTARSAADGMESIRDLDYPYGRRTAEAGLAGLAGAVVLLLGGGPLGILLAGVVTYAVLVVGRWTANRGLPVFFGNAASAAIVTAVATAAYAVGLPVMPSLVVAGGIVALLPSVAMLSAVQDALAGYVVTAAGRIVEVFVLLAGIASGVGLVLAVAVPLGVPLREISAEPAGAPLWMALTGGALASALFLLSVYAPTRLLVPAAAIGTTSGLIFAGGAALGLQPLYATAAAAVVAGTVAVVVAGRYDVPALVPAVAGFMPLLPGLALYRGMFRIVMGETAVGIATVLGAIGVVTALASGVVLGDLAARRLRRLRRLWDRDPGPEPEPRADRDDGPTTEPAPSHPRGRSRPSRFFGPSIGVARRTGARRRGEDV